MLSKDEMMAKLKEWYNSWNQHNLIGVMALLHEDILFDDWSGRKIQGKRNLERSWKAWFNRDDDFLFTEIDTYIDQDVQKAVFRWQLSWPSSEKAYRGRSEKRDGVDLLTFKHDLIYIKNTYSKTFIEIESKNIQLVPSFKINSSS